MTAAVPVAEFTSYFGERDVAYWRRHMGQLCDPVGLAELYALEHDEAGCHLADRQLSVPVCVYVAVDDVGACLYVGQCRRPNGSVVQRIDHHHAIPPFARGLWVLPLRLDCPKAALDRLERRLIEAYKPPFNTIHCPPGYSVGTWR